MHRGGLITASVLAALAVALGAFGAHGLKAYADPNLLNTFETAVRYQFYHAVALALASVIHKEYPGKFLSVSRILFQYGIVFFSGSLYLLTALSLSGNNAFRWLGAVTPLGGICFIGGWICLALAVYKSGRSGK